MAPLSQFCLCSIELPFELVRWRASCKLQEASATAEKEVDSRRIESEEEVEVESG